MNIYTLSVASALPNRPGASPRPKLNFCSEWLTDIGFTPGVLVQVLPRPGGMDFILCDENISRYSELYKDTREKNGVLVMVSPNNRMEVSGTCIRNAGLDIGDLLIGLYDYGLIKLRKLPGKAKIIPAGKDGLTGKPKIRMTGDWLAEIGFVTGAVVSAAATPGAVTFKLQKDGIEDYRALVKHARENREQILQVHRDGYARCIEVGGAFLETSGFCADGAYIAVYEYGLITVRQPDLKQLGF